jgi:single-strand DNA-binding protein
MISITPVGRLTKDADLKYLDDGTPVARFTLACKRKRQDKDGNDRTTFVQCVLWGKRGEAFATYTRKGALVLVDGELTNRNYDDQQGVTHYITEVNVEHFEFLESKQTVQNRDGQRNNNSLPPEEHFNGDPGVSENDAPYYGKN